MFLQKNISDNNLSYEITMKLKKYNEILLTNNKMDLNIRKMTNRPPSHANNSTFKIKLVSIETIKNLTLFIIYYTEIFFQSDRWLYVFYIENSTENQFNSW